MRIQKRKMRNMRTGLAILLVFLLVFSGVLTTVAAETIHLTNPGGQQINSFINKQDVYVNFNGLTGEYTLRVSQVSGSKTILGTGTVNIEAVDSRVNLWNSVTNNGETGYDSINQGTQYKVEALGTAGDNHSKTFTVENDGAPVPTYTVIYDGNGNDSGTAPVDSNSPYEADETVTVLGNSGDLLKTGYTFAGWNTQADGNGTNYAAGDTFAMPSNNVTLYAKWTQNQTYTVNYNGNTNTGGTVPTDSNDYEAEDTVTVLGNPGSLVKTGYTFAGWNTQADGNGTNYAAGDTFAMPSNNVTLYAKWTQNQTYTVNYNGNTNTGGTVPTDSNDYEAEDTVTVLGNPGSLVKTGYTFAGWNTQVDGNGTNYAAGATFAMPANNVTLYAVWNEDQNGGGGPDPTTYTVTYDGNGNTSGTAPIDLNSPYAVDATVTVLGNSNLAKTGFTFAGWNTKSDGEGTAYKAGDTFIITANTTLYAVWNEIIIETPPPTSGGRTSSRTPAVPRENVPEFVEEILEVVLPEVPAAPPIIEAPVLDEAPLAAPPVLPQTGDAGVLATILSGLGVSLSGLAMKFRKKGKDDSVTTLFK
ncbi:MAG: InlB B-repeat-containing protein [Bacillota bacterium]|nr:InlB B-repeat-containing protein [Bacillota bacterium]